MDIVEDIDHHITQCHLMKTPRVLPPKSVFGFFVLSTVIDQVSLFILAARELTVKSMVHL